MRKTDKNNNCCTQSCFIQEELIVHWEHVLRHDRHYVCEILIEPYLLLGYIYSTRVAFPLMVSHRLNSHPFCMLPWECQSGCTDESCNKSAAKADAGRDLMCFHHHHHQRVTYRRIQRALKWKEHRNKTPEGIFSLVCENNGDSTGISASIWCCYTTDSFNKVVQKHKIPNKRQSKSTNYCHANLSSHTCCNNSYFHPSLAESFTTLKAYACREF